MKKDALIHYIFLISYLIIFSLINNWLSLAHWPLFLGAFIGNLLPDIDHFIYVYFLQPQDLTSQRVNYMIQKRQFIATLKLLSDTREERSKLIFHTILFQMVFFALTVLIVTSSASFFAKGLVLAFYLHLLVDQVIDNMQMGNLDNWFRAINLALDRKKYTIFLLVNTLLFAMLSIAA